MIHVAKLHRRAVLGLAAGFIAQPLWNEPAVSAVQAPPLDSPLGAEAVGALLEQHKVPGASLAIIAEGELAATYGYGFAHGQRAVMPQTRFQAASISKIVNALAVLKLAEAGRIGLDDPVNKYLKSWKLPDNELTATSAVTVRMLLNHTGGTNVHGFAGYARDANLPSLREILDGQEPANTPAIRVISPPGEAHKYSGGGTTVLQQMLIDVTGEAYALTLARMVLGPPRHEREQFPTAARCGNGRPGRIRTRGRRFNRAGRLPQLSGNGGSGSVDHPARSMHGLARDHALACGTGRQFP
jgi:CubicO group peptidase (beta-lactamase class C family)